MTGFTADNALTMNEIMKTFSELENKCSTLSGLGQSLDPTAATEWGRDVSDLLKSCAFVIHNALGTYSRIVVSLDQRVSKDYGGLFDAISQATVSFLFVTHVRDFAELGLKFIELIERHVDSAPDDVLVVLNDTIRWLKGSAQTVTEAVIKAGHFGTEYSEGQTLQ